VDVRFSHHTKNPPQYISINEMAVAVKSIKMLWLPVFGSPCLDIAIPSEINAREIKINCGA
jgi:hypothetical protein